MARKSHRDSAVRVVTAKRGPEREPPRLGNTVCYGQELARKSHRDSAVRFVTAKRGPDCYGQELARKKPPRRGSTICYGQTCARRSHQDSAIRFVTAKNWPERATKTRQYDLLRPRVGQKKPPRLGSTICYGQTWVRKSHQDSAVRFVMAKRGPERATKTRQYDLLRPRVGQKSHRDSAVRFVTAKRGPERTTKTRQYDLVRPTERATETRQFDLLRPNVGQKEPPRLGSTICYGQELARKSHQDSAVRFVKAKSWPEKATKTRQYDLLRPNVGQKEPPRLGSTICYGQELARKSYQDSAVRFVTAKRGPERATKTRQYDLLRPNVGQKEPPRLGSTICYGQELARKSHQDSAVRFVMAKRGPERATKTRQYDLLRPRVGQKEPPRLGSTICYGQELARKSLQDSAVRFVTAKRGPERATKTRQCDLLRPRVGQKEPPRLGSTICYGQQLARKSHQDLAVRFVTANRKSHRDSAVQSVTAKRGPERVTKTRQYDLLRPRVGQNMPPRLGSTICYGQTWARRATKTRQYDLLRPNVGQKEPPRLGSTICYGQELARKSHRDSAVRFVTATANRKSHQDAAVRFVTAKSCPERATKTRHYDLLRPNVGQKEPPRLGFDTAKSWPERATETRQYDLLRANVGQKEPPRLGSTIRYGQTCARKSHQDSAVRFVTAKSWPERATKTRQYDLLRPRVVQKEPPRLGSTICYGQTWARKSHQDSAVRLSTANRKSHRDSAVRFVTAKRGPERATETRQYDLLRPRVGQKMPPRLGRQYDLLRPNVGQKEPPRLGSTICYGQELARKSLQDSAVRFVTAKRGPERATKTRQYELLRPRAGQKEPPRLGSTICYGQELARKSHQDSAVRFVTAKRGPERATETRLYDLLRPNVGQKEPPRLGSTICYSQTWARISHRDSAVHLLRPNVGQKEPPRLGNTIC